jgi:hypothetical protein
MKWNGLYFFWRAINGVRGGDIDSWLYIAGYYGE